jgi:ketosteroid isomerase-like protein
MTPPRVETVSAVLDAFVGLDAEECVSHMTDDILLRPSAFMTGKGEYRGREEILEGFAEMIADLEARGERFRVKVFHHYLDELDEDKVLSLCQLTITRDNGDEYGTDIAYLWRMEGDKVAELNAWLDHAEGLRQLQFPVEADA